MIKIHAPPRFFFGFYLIKILPFMVIKGIGQLSPLKFHIILLLFKWKGWENDKILFF